MTSALPTPVVSAEWVVAHGVAVSVVDARAGAAGRAAYEKAHVLGAAHAHSEHVLAAPTSTPERGGRHPLPDVGAFCVWLGNRGIGPHSRVVVYDDVNGANAAARFWWMMRALGHQHVAVVDGGLAALEAAGVHMDTHEPPPATIPAYPADRFAWPVVDIDAIDRLRTDPAARLVDARAAFRFRGESEPIDPVAGHIPGAINVPYADNLDASGRFKSPEELLAIYSAALGDVPAPRAIAMCGSGVTACHTILAMERAGLTGAALYVGSWGEWCRQPRPRAP